MFAWCKSSGLARAPIWSLSNINCEEITSLVQPPLEGRPPPGPWETQGLQHSQYFWHLIASTARCVPTNISKIGKTIDPPVLARIPWDLFRSPKHHFLVLLLSKSWNESNSDKYLERRPCNEGQGQRYQRKGNSWMKSGTQAFYNHGSTRRRGIWRGRRWWKAGRPGLYLSLCFCVFVYLCFCIFVFCICISTRREIWRGRWWKAGRLPPKAVPVFLCLFICVFVLLYLRLYFQKKRYLKRKEVVESLSAAAEAEYLFQISFTSRYYQLLPCSGCSK